MSKKTLILISIIGLGIIFLFCILLHQRSIEKDIAQCSQDILNQASFNQLIVVTKDRGRDVMVSGFVKSKASKDKAIDILKNQCHMTSLENQIQIKKPEPNKQAHISIVFNERNELLNFTGTAAKETVETNFGFLMDSYKRAKNFKLSIVGNDDIIPVDYHRYTSVLLPLLNQIDAANINFDGKQITLKGDVANELIKNQVEQSISHNLGDDVTIINLLTIIEPSNQTLVDELVEQKPLDANHCQQELSTLLLKSKIHFDSGSAQISNDSLDLLNHLANTTISCQGVTVEIIGHTDKSGNENNNIKLSKARAIAVANYLVKKGVAGEKLKAKGVGSSQPIATNQTKQGRSQNRRIEFKVHSLEE